MDLSTETGKRRHPWGSDLNRRRHMELYPAALHSIRLMLVLSSAWIRQRAFIVLQRPSVFMAAILSSIRPLTRPSLAPGPDRCWIRGLAQGWVVGSDHGTFHSDNVGTTLTTCLPKRAVSCDLLQPPRRSLIMSVGISHLGRTLCS
jgi:hypothetical protein